MYVTDLHLLDGLMMGVLLYCCCPNEVRLPLETESAALGAALQAAAVHHKVPVAEFVASNQPPLSDKVSRGGGGAAISTAGSRTEHAKLEQEDT